MPSERALKIAAAGLVMACALLVGGRAPLAQTTGPITVAAAKAAKARTVPQQECLDSCKSRSSTRASSVCANWCTPGQCYQSSKEAYCVK